MGAKRLLILELYLKSKQNWGIFKNLKNLNMSKRLIERTLKHLKKTGSIEIRHSGGRNCSVRTKNLIKCIRERIRRIPAQSAIKISRDLNL